MFQQFPDPHKTEVLHHPDIYLTKRDDSDQMNTVKKGINMHHLTYNSLKEREAKGLCFTSRKKR